MKENCFLKYVTTNYFQINFDQKKMFEMVGVNKDLFTVPNSKLHCIERREGRRFGVRPLYT